MHNYHFHSVLWGTRCWDSHLISHRLCIHSELLVFISVESPCSFSSFPVLKEFQVYSWFVRALSGWCWCTNQLSILLSVNCCHTPLICFWSWDVGRRWNFVVGLRERWRDYYSRSCGGSDVYDSFKSVYSFSIVLSQFTIFLYLFLSFSLSFSRLHYVLGVILAVFLAAICLMYIINR